MCQIYTLHGSHTHAQTTTRETTFRAKGVRSLQNWMERSEKAVVLKRYGRHIRDIMSDLRGCRKGLKWDRSEPFWSRSLQTCCQTFILIRLPHNWSYSLLRYSAAELCSCHEVLGLKFELQTTKSEVVSIRCDCCQWREGSSHARRGTHLSKLKDETWCIM